MGASFCRIVLLMLARAGSVDLLVVDPDPILAYTAEAEINQLRWSAAHTNWVSISYDKNLQVLRV